jgi:predicted aminopeptidase
MGVVGTLISGCSPGYVVRAAYEQSKILLARRPIDDVIADSATAPEDKKKLEYVLQARTFASEIGLNPGNSFTAYSDIGKDTLAWVVVASRKDAFALHTWWFPIVGTVPYKGFFSHESALEQARSLEEKGFESSVRGTEAFSTLGWFNDPLLSTTLRNPTPRIVNTVLHESVHSTVWIKNNVSFNETLASFVGSQATIQFFSQKNNLCTAQGTDCPESASFLRTAQDDHSFQLEFAVLIERLYSNLDALYSDRSLSSPQKIESRVSIFEETLKPFRAKYPRMTALKAINNAEIMQFTIYMTKLTLFEQLFKHSGGVWSKFFAAISTIKDAIDHDSSKDPFKELENMISTKHDSSATKNSQGL